MDCSGRREAWKQQQEEGRDEWLAADKWDMDIAEKEKSKCGMARGVCDPLG